MKNLLNFTTIILIALAMVFTSCDKEDDDDEIVNKSLVTGTVTIDAASYDKWVYFSFSDEKEITVSDFSNSTAWDIGFHRQDVRVNCGTSGIGDGGTYNAGKVDFSSIIEAPELGYALNDSINILHEFAMPFVYFTVPGDTLLAPWVNISFGQSGPEYIYSDDIYVVKTADGKYVKIWLKDYFSDESETGHITMKYVYQPDGSRKFE